MCNGQRATVVLLLGFSLAGPPASGQSCEDRDVRWGRVAVISGGFALTQAAAIVVRGDDWWTTPRTAFHVTTGGSPSLGQDKLLHAAISYHLSQLSAFAWDWACVSRPAAGWLGAAVGILAGLPKEFGDGLHEDKGFAADDLAAGMVAAVLPALHRTVPVTRAVLLKGNYWPSDELRASGPALPSLENDYAGQRYFLAVNPGRIPGGAGAWPDWLGVAVGHSVTRWASAPPVREVYLTLDLNVRGIPVNAGWWRRVATVLDQIHIPLPGIRIVEGEVTVGIW